MSDDVDILVLGAGPAGLALAAACATTGSSVTVVAPAPDAPWPRTFALWADELPALGEAAVVAATWDAPRVWIDEETALDLPARYVRLDAPALQRSLIVRCRRAGVALCAGTAVDVVHDPTGSTVLLASGEVLRASMVVDATGPATPFIRRIEARAPAFQSAVGELIETDGELPMALMDFRGPPLDPPSFLYALPLGPGPGSAPGVQRVFVEETVLASRVPVSRAELSMRLHRRLAGAGVRTLRVIEHEVCSIPLGVARPDPGQRTVAFGAAASFVHPATGYQLARAFAMAPPVAGALAGGGSPEARSRRAYAAMWPSSARGSWDLFTFGLEAICRLDHARLCAFLRAFFALSPGAWGSFLRGTATPGAVALAMAQLVVRADPAVTARILRTVPSQLRTLARALPIPELT
jgi:lycopene cyclase-like protein